MHWPDTARFAPPEELPAESCGFAAASTHPVVFMGGQIEDCARGVLDLLSQLHPTEAVEPTVCQARFV